MIDRATCSILPVAPLSFGTLILPYSFIRRMVNKAQPGTQGIKMTITPQAIISYWYSDRLKLMWFASTPALDKEILDQFGSLWEAACAGELDSWTSSPEGSLALIIILDQLPLNMFRGQAKCFSSEKKAVETTLVAINKNFDKRISLEKLAFLYMPLMHSENLTAQNLSVQKFTDANLDANLRFALHHREIIKKFGRFPHRNKILGRKNTEAEIEYLASKEAYHG